MQKGKEIKSFNLKFGNTKELIGLNQIIPVKTISCTAKLSIEDKEGILRFFYFVISNEDGEEFIFSSEKCSKQMRLKDKIYFVLVAKPIKCFISNESLKSFSLEGKSIILKIEYAISQNNAASN